MRKKLSTASIIQLTRETTRTPLFWLLYDRHAELSETWNGHRVKWPVVCAWITACGVTDKQGKAIQPGAAKMCWRRVCASKAQEQAEQQAKLRPAPVPARPSYAALRPPEPKGEREVQEMVDGIRETIYRRSGRSWPPSGP